MAEERLPAGAALVHSLRSTVLQTQIEQEHPGTPLIPAARFATVESLPAAWRSWAQGWKYCKAVNLDETAGLPRPPEPVEMLLSCPVEQVVSLAREVRVAQVTADGVLKEVPCQTHGEVRRGAERLAKVLFMAAGPAQCGKGVRNEWHLNSRIVVLGPSLAVLSHRS